MEYNNLILVVNTKIDNSLIFLQSMSFKKSSTIIIIIFLVLPKNENFSFTVESPDSFSIIVWIWYKKIFKGDP